MDLLDGHDTWQVVIGAKVCEVRRIAPTLDLDVNKARRYLVQLWPRSPDRLPIYLWLQRPVLLQIWNKMQHCRAPELPLNSYYALGFNKTGILALEHHVDICKYVFFGIFLSQNLWPNPDRWWLNCSCSRFARPEQFRAKTELICKLFICSTDFKRKGKKDTPAFIPVFY